MDIKSIWGMFKSMFTSTDIRRMVGGDVELTSTMIDYIDLWAAMLRGQANWTREIPSLGIEAGVCRELADISVNEMDVAVDNDTLNTDLENCLRGLNEGLQDGLALGSFVIRPAGGGAEYISASNFIPIAFNAFGKLIDCMFLYRKTRNDTTYYCRCERFTLDERGLTVTNKAYISASMGTLGNEVPLTSVDGWEDLPEETTYSGMETMPFGYYKNPVKNRIDGSQCGVSIYQSAVDLIKRADLQGARIDWEYESGERAIHVDERALKHANNKVSMAKLSHRLYRGLNIDTANGELLKEYSPTMRDDAFRQGLEDYLRRIEFSVGLAYGDLSDANYVDKTATEIKAAKQRKYNRVTAIQTNLRDCIIDLVKAIAFYEGLYTSQYNVTCTFKDSILADEEAERNQDRQDVSMGVMRLEEYRAKWYGEDIETAANNLPPSTDLVLDTASLRGQGDEL